MNEIQDVVVILAKCGENHKTYGIRAEKSAPDQWKFTWAFPIKDDAARREGYDKSFVKGNISFSDEYPGCPYCGNSNWTLCSCGHLSCTVLKNGIFTCEWCGTQGEISAYTGESIKAGMDL